MKKIMSGKEIEYLKIEFSDVKILRTEILFTPLLVVLPVVVSLLFIYHWFSRGISLGNPAFDGELMLGIIILVGNIIFDIPFITSLRRSLRGR